MEIHQFLLPLLTSGLKKEKKMVWEKDQTSGKCNFVYKDLFCEPEACLTHGNIKKM